MENKIFPAQTEIYNTTAKDFTKTTLCVQSTNKKKLNLKRFSGLSSVLLNDPKYVQNISLAKNKKEDLGQTNFRNSPRCPQIRDYFPKNISNLLISGFPDV